MRVSSEDPGHSFRILPGAPSKHGTQRPQTTEITWIESLAGRSTLLSTLCTIHFIPFLDNSFCLLYIHLSLQYPALSRIDISCLLHPTILLTLGTKSIPFYKLYPIIFYLFTPPFQRSFTPLHKFSTLEYLLLIPPTNNALAIFIPFNLIQRLASRNRKQENNFNPARPRRRYRACLRYDPPNSYCPPPQTPAPSSF
ncbi:hypothetical protein BDQ17DRAFT_1424421 [Cyathus striatus]|nr:hypothetical protein BDQ17DRAFT_1424421 [Cyathus striatus]